MGANKRSDRQKCGEILINIKTIKNKSKIFTFHCAFCRMDCDQLKKFSKHLDKHFNCFDNLENIHEQIEGSITLFESEDIKVEEQLDVVLIDKNDKVVSDTTTSQLYEDPLETEKCHKSDLNKLDKTQELMSINLKNENNGHGDENNCKISFESIKKFEKSSKIAEECKTNTNNVHTFEQNDFSSDDLTDYSSAADVDVTTESKTTSNSKRSKCYIIKKKSRTSERKKKSKEEILEHEPNKATNNQKSKRRRRVIVETILPFLIEQYKQFKMLWQVDDIAFGVKNKKYEVYSKIAEELKLEENRSMSLEDINYHLNYLNELYSKDKELELKCKMEKQQFSPEYEHYGKLSFLCDSQGPFLCTICNEILPKYDPYCQHMAQHNKTQPFKCPSCNMLFTNYHKFLIHKKRHLGIYNFHCDICGKGYLFKNDLEWHVTSHTGDKPYLCQICGTGFRARHGYDNHIRRHEERFRYECHICKRGFNQLHALNNHVKSHLNIRDVICKICGKGFVHTKYLKRHELIHGKEKRYKCNECGKAFFQACGLRAHRKNHHS